MLLVRPFSHDMQDLMHNILTVIWNVQYFQKIMLLIKILNLNTNPLWRHTLEMTIHCTCII